MNSKLILKKVIKLMVFCLLSVSIISCAKVQAKKINKNDYSRQEHSDAKYVMDTSNGPHGRALDLSDARDYRFLLSQFNRSGMTKNKFPQLHKSIEEAKVYHLKNGVPETVLDQDNDDFTYSPFIHNLTGISTSNDSDYHAAAELAVSGKPYSVALSLALHDSNNQPIGIPTSLYSNTGDPYYHLNTQQNTQDSVVKGVFLSFFTVEGVPYSPRASTLETAETLPILTNLDPSPVVAGQDIIVCVNRTPNTSNNCKYGTVKGTKTVDLKLNGNIVYPNAIKVDGNNPEILLATFTATNTSGGGCVASGPNPLGFQQASTMSNSNKTLTYSIDHADFVTKTKCLAQGDKLIYNSYIAVTESDSGNPLTAQVTSAATIPPADNVVIIPELSVFAGCLAAGTKVEIEGGNKPRIETLFNGTERVVTGNNTIKTSKGLTEGTEEKPMIYIEDKKGRNLMLTEMHPVVTYDGGIKLAMELKKGDVLIARDGKTIIEKVLRKKYKGKVYNITLGANGEEVTMDNTTFFANEFLVGDANMQNAYAKAYKNKPTEVLKRLPKKWHIDFMNSDDYKLGRR
ncbi:MAG: hypothetical protein JKY19_06840 [Alcanivoracaceae bacterium]|nr:hypothetical protein [Alcanivoracaceae bacterium]